jgi:hypothetical protein
VKLRRILSSTSHLAWSNRSNRCRSEPGSCAPTGERRVLFGGVIVPLTPSQAKSNTHFIVRFFALCSVGAIALTVAACGGGGGEENFTRSDVLRILDVAPTTPPGSSWTKDDGVQQISLEHYRQTLKSQPERKSEIDALADAGLRRGFKQGWASSGATAQGSATIFPDAAAAHKAFGPLQHLTPSWFLPLPVEELGDEAVSSRGDPGAIYMWRRGNLVLSAWMLRGSGPAFDYEAAARAYADKLDERATTG